VDALLDQPRRRFPALIPKTLYAITLAALRPDLLISLHALPGPCPCTAVAAWAPAARCMLQRNTLQDRLADAWYMRMLRRLLGHRSAVRRRGAACALGEACVAACAWCVHDVQGYKNGLERCLRPACAEFLLADGACVLHAV
jgi:hypothetical protein